MCFAKFKVKKEEKQARVTILKYDDEKLDSTVKIQGTQYDRKRKLTDAQLKEIKEKLSKNIPIEALAEEYDVSEWVIKYNTNPDFREHQLKIRTGKHTGVDTMTFENRVAYKRSLIKDKKIKVRGLI